MRKTFLLLGLLLAVSPCMAEPGVFLRSDTPAVRGRVVTYTVSLNADAKDLVGLRFDVRMNSDAVPFVGQKNQPIFQMEGLLVGKSATATGIKADGPSILAGTYTTHQFPQTGVFNASWGEPVSGPGDVMSFKAYYPIEQLFCYEGGGFGGCGGGFNIFTLPYIAQANATDAQGNSIVLGVNSDEIKTDFRYYGDVNKDQLLTVADAIQILRYLVGFRTFTPSEAWYADVHLTSLNGQPQSTGRHMGNGTVDVGDAVRIMQVITGLWKNWWPDPKP